MPALKSKQAVGNNSDNIDGEDDDSDEEKEEDGDHIFQYGLIPLKVTCGEQDEPIFEQQSF